MEHTQICGRRFRHFLNAMWRGLVHLRPSWSNVALNAEANLSAGPWPQ